MMTLAEAVAVELVQAAEPIEVCSQCGRPIWNTFEGRSMCCGAPTEYQQQPIPAQLPAGVELEA